MLEKRELVRLIKVTTNYIFGAVLWGKWNQSSIMIIIVPQMSMMMYIFPPIYTHVRTLDEHNCMVLTKNGFL